MSDGVRCMWMRGGTSKGGFLLAEDLPQEVAARDAFLIRLMGSPDARQIDGLGGGDPLTSKIAVVRRSQRAEAEVDYLFLQVFVDRAVVTDSQNCGNMLAGVGPFAVERGLVPVRGEQTRIRIFMENTDQVATATVATPDGLVTYKGDARIDGVPGTAAAVPIVFEDTAGSTCGALLPTGRPVDEIDGVAVTLIDNGMPCVVLRASDLGISGYEAPKELEANQPLRQKVEAIRLKAGPMMNLGDVTNESVPKMVMVAPPRGLGSIMTRSFIPRTCHSSIGVFAAVSVATACLLPDAPAAALARIPPGAEKTMSIQHPTGEMSVVATVDERGNVVRAGILRTARKLFDGLVFAG